ncbi:flavodoxin [Caldicellulosiruptor changbaiensis]|uniref:flavodoxin n=1 Tax=Caldicellulosiruptor changbaiensis TaxID=1222016 RepID=UPI001F496618|nr:flavodoxin [Caldicellulosiruptor changbaiensis]
MAQKIQKLTGGDLFEIKPAKQYPEDYYETIEVAKEEKRKNARPELANKLEDISPYEVVFLGYPNWWGTMPMAVFTFLESYDFAGKTIAPFCTHEGSGLGSSERDIKKLCPNANVLPGLAIRGSSVNQADKDIQNWLSRLGLLT